MPDLRVDLSGIHMRNPTMLASGVLGSSAPMLMRVFDEGAGAVVSKSVGLKPRAGYPNPTIVETDCGFVNAMGLPNPGAEKFAEEVRMAKRAGVELIASVFGFTTEEYVRTSAVMEEAGADAVELNLSCPHVVGTGTEIGSQPDLVTEVVRQVKDATSVPIFAKIGASYPRVRELGSAIEKGGADGITAINTVKAAVIDINTRKPILANVFGGLSGPAIRPLATRCVYELYDGVSIPIIGVGGIVEWKDAVEFILAGATAVQIGTGIAKRGLSIFREITEGIERYLIENGFESIEDLRGLAHGG